MPITFGSVGDIVSVSLVFKDLLIALSDSRGSSAEYQSVVRELYVLDTALLQVELLSRSRAATPELHALYETSKQTVVKCRDSIAACAARTRKYSESLEVGGSGNILEDTARKIQWRASHKATDIAKLRAEFMGYSDSIDMLLAAGIVKLLSTKNDDLKDQLAQDGRTTHAAFDIHNQALQEVRTKSDDNRRLISTGNSLASRMVERLEWVQKLGSELKPFLSNVVVGNIAVYHKVVTLCSAFSKHVDRPLPEDPFLLDDAIGCIAPVHLRFINSWSAFQTAMEIRFQGKQGLRKILRMEYVLRESATERDVDLSLNFEDAILPGQKITMSLVFKHWSTKQATQASVHCPGCYTRSKQPTDVDVWCSKCNMRFRRITESDEVDVPRPTPRIINPFINLPSCERVPFEPKPVKRKLEEGDGEDGDYSRFKRTRGEATRDTSDFGVFNRHWSFVMAAIAAREEEYAKSNYTASLEDYERMVRRLLDYGISFDAQGRCVTVLQAASARGYEPVVRLLLHKGADVNAPGGKYGNALQAASASGHEETVQLLLDKGANVNTQGGKYGSALQAASASGHEETVQLLLDKGANVNTQGGVYGDALQAALVGGHEQIVNLLLDKGANAVVQLGDSYAL